jgi:hypothetical protein
MANIDKYITKDNKGNYYFNITGMDVFKDIANLLKDTVELLDNDDKTMTMNKLADIMNKNDSEGGYYYDKDKGDINE